MSYEVVRSNTHIRDSITRYDFIPDGIAVAVDPETGRIHLPLDPKWRSSNYLIFASGRSLDGHIIVYHNSLTVTAGGRVRVSIDGGAWQEASFSGPIYYRNVGYRGLPTVYKEQNGNTILIALDAPNRIWHHLVRIEQPFFELDAVMQAESIPFWMGKAEGPFIGHGVYRNIDDLDIWGGYVDLGSVTTTVRTSQGERIFNGSGCMDREYHRQYSEETAEKINPLCFTAMSMHVPGKIDMALLQAINPIDLSDLYKGIPLEHQSRINFPGQGLDYTFNDFIYSDNGENPVDDYVLTGDFEAGSIDLVGKAIKFFGWSGQKGTWWDSSLNTYWGRSFVVWNGQIEVLGNIVEVENAIGFGEFTRVGTSPIMAALPAVALGAGIGGSVGYLVGGKRGAVVGSISGAILGAVLKACSTES